MKRSLAIGALAAAAAFGLIAVAAGIEGDSASEDSAGTRASAPAAEPPPARAELELGRDLFARMGCGSCHALAAAGTRGEIGPDLDERLPSHDRASLVAAIVNPPSAGSAYSGMPENFGERMSVRELDSLAAYLLSTRSGR